MIGPVVLHGVALHRGGPAEVRLSAAPGPIVIEQGNAAVPASELGVARADRGVTLASADGRIRVDLVEHLFAALGGLGIHEGVRIAAGPEVPLLDGGAARFAEALRGLAIPRRMGSLVVAKDATLRHGDAIYRFAKGAGVRLRVEVSFRAPAGRQAAAWDGDEEDFVARIAPARTFGWADEHAALTASGRAAAVDLASVIVFDGEGTLPGCRPAEPDEIARHKLLDLLGDLAIHGGPPRGSIEASRPGHAATHAVVAEALATGVLAREAS